MANKAVLLSICFLQWISIVATKDGETLCITEDQTTYVLCNVLCFFEYDNCTEERQVDSPNFATDSKEIRTFWQSGYDHHVTEISENWFPTENNIRTVLLAQDEITHLKSSDFVNLKHLRRISIIKCNVKSYDVALFDNLNDLQLLDFSDNSIVDIVPFGDLAALNELHLEFNAIEILKSDVLGKYTKLEKLQLQFNKIHTIEPCTFCALNNLQSLSLDKNSLTSLPSDFTKGLTSLKVLSLQNNKMAAITANVFTEDSPLETLNLDNNIISAIEPKSFAMLKSLKNLHLNGNSLVTIQDESFAGLTSLEVLQLDGNKIACVPDVLLGQFKTLTAVDISMKNNLWACACKSEVDAAFLAGGVTKYTSGEDCIQ